jgi:hypothetical protein
MIQRRWNRRLTQKHADKNHGNKKKVTVSPNRFYPDSACIRLARRLKKDSKTMEPQMDADARRESKITKRNDEFEVCPKTPE